ncbi:hypothetical protein J7K43_07335 [Candidatus Calescamantes bacterium]|nr:hypothetical protein [Candidatus Calescamantes bacterium]
MKRNYLFLLMGLIAGFLIVIAFTQRSEAQKTTTSLIAVSPGSTTADPTLFIINPETRVLCVYQVQGPYLRFLAKRKITKDFLVKDFHTK